jgi:hypothetical protein
VVATAEAAVVATAVTVEEDTYENYKIQYPGFV